MTRRLSAFGLSIMAVAALSGCRMFSSSCNAPPTYGTGEDRPPLKIPAGLEEPNTRNALRIPELNEPEKPARGKSDPCLEEPPQYETGADKSAPGTKKLPAPPPPETRN